MSIGIKPLKDNVALKAKPVEESTTSGIIIPGDKDEQKNFAEVVAVGDGTKDERCVESFGLFEDRVSVEVAGLHLGDGGVRAVVNHLGGFINQKQGD